MSWHTMQIECHIILKRILLCWVENSPNFVIKSFLKFQGVLLCDSLKNQSQNLHHQMFDQQHNTELSQIWCFQYSARSLMLRLVGWWVGGLVFCLEPPHLAHPLVSLATIPYHTIPYHTLEEIISDNCFLYSQTSSNPTQYKRSVVTLNEETLRL